MAHSDKLSRARFIYYSIILVVAPVLIYLFAVRGMRFFLVPSGSMEPTLIPGDYLVTLTENRYDRGDIVVLKDPAEERSFIVKRIVGVAGDQVDIQGGALILNGKYASEPYVVEPMERQFPQPITVPEGGVFVMGDNRNHSEDSSLWGRALKATDIVGEVKLRYLPLNRAGLIHSYPLTNSEGR